MKEFQSNLNHLTLLISIIKPHLSKMSFWEVMEEQENQWFWHMLQCGLSKTTGLWSMSPVHTNGPMIEKPNMRELTMVFMLSMNMQYNGSINSKLVTNTFFQKFKSSLNFMVSLTSQELMRKNTSLFLIFGMKEERFISTKLKKFSNTEWMRQQSLNKKNKPLSEWQMS